MHFYRKINHTIDLLAHLQLHHEGVRWFVLKSYDTVSKEQVKQFLHVMHHPNNIPIQDIGARKVLD